nr:NAD(P)H-hydrate epimerase [Acidobacteriota bacterium]
MKALTAAEMREVDRLTTAQCGISGTQLMEAAGKHVCDAVLRGINRLQRARNGAVNSPVREVRVSMLCGKGNNGGDGFVAARHLRVAGVDAQVYLFGDASRVSGDAGENLQRWRKAGGSVAAVTTDAGWEKAWKEIAESHVIVDALLGTGLRGPATGLMARAISELNELSGNATAVRPALMIAVDMPSGLPSDGGPAEGPVLRAHRTVTFSGPKIGQLVSSDAVACGVLEVCQIGSPKELVEKTAEGGVRSIDAEDFSGLRLIRVANANKGSYGHVLL